MKLISISLATLALAVFIAVPANCQQISPEAAKLMNELSKPSPEIEKIIMEQQRNKKTREKAPIVYVIKDIAKGERITADALEQKRVPKDSIPSYLIADPNDAIGCYANYTLKQGSALGTLDFSSPNSYRVDLGEDYGKKLRKLAKTRNEREALLNKWIKSAIDAFPSTCQNP